MNPLYPGLVAVLLYFAATLLQSGILSRVPASTARPSTLLLIVALCAVGFHALSLYHQVFTEAGLNLGIATVANLIGWVLAAVVLLSCLWQPIQSLFLIVFPVAILGIGSGLFLNTEYQPIQDVSGGLILHILLSIIAYTILMLAACQSIVLALQERLLHNKSPIGILRRLPPLQRMEAVLFQFIWIGLIMLTLSIGSGFVFLADMFAQHVAHHTILALVSWVVFVTLLIGRHAFGWRGTTATQWTLVGFGFLVLAYFGSKFVLEILLGTQR